MNIDSEFVSKIYSYLQIKYRELMDYSGFFDELDTSLI